MKIPILLLAGLAVGLLAAADYPQAEISSPHIRAKLYLPDAKSGFYRGSRFDWSGVISSLVYQGHDYYGPWFDRMDPKVSNFIYDGQAIVASDTANAMGPVEEFRNNGRALGWDEAQPGGTFVKIGVGVLRKDAAPYSPFKPYELVDPGKWTVDRHADSIEFTQEVADASSGYGYIYKKIVRLAKDQPVMELEHTLKNTGRRPIETNVYNHNFLVLDKQAPGPDFKISFPFQIQNTRPPNRTLAEFRGNQVVYLKALEDRETVSATIQGFGATAKDNEIRLENTRVGAGMRITGDHPLSRMELWSIRTTLCFEPYVVLSIEPGKEAAWKMTYEYYTLPGR